MAGIQVLGAEQDPTMTALQKSQERLQETMRMRQSFEVTKQELAIKAKTAKSEEEKQLYDNMKFQLETLEKVKSKKLSPDGVAKILGQLTTHSGEDGINQFAELTRMVTTNAAEPSPEAMKTLNDARKSGAEADYFENPGNFMEKLQTGFGVPDASNANVQRRNTLTPGSSLSMPMPGGGTLFTPLNRELSVPAADSITKGEFSKTLVSDINTMINDGVFGTNSLDRTARQAAVQAPSAIWTSGNKKLSAFRGVYNKLRIISLFDEAGKALTGTEKEEALRLLELTGKSDSEILNDLNYLTSKNGYKADLLLGGSYAVSGKPGGFGPEKEHLIQANMQAYPGQSREDVILALQKKGKL